jgi:diaminohydroxyphosphoribosylaminopyrimidine deaminase/5-amino-6-(5-phosphoribosylamino)uracil reductase
VHAATTADDRRFMLRALRLARRGEGRVEPNPMVGCVIVRDGRIIGEGWHRGFGGPHAEVEALRACRQPPRGTTVYVTLEPCCHWGKTPPCTEALIAAGVGRVVAALRDPNPQISGRGVRRLRRAGIRVDLGPLEAEAAALVAPYRKWVRRKRPWVIAKWAQSLDGCIARRASEGRWISDEAARRHAHAVRGRVDAILVGVGTVLADDPLLTCRLVRPKRLATRVVLDSALRTPPGSRLVRTARQVPTLIFCGQRVAARRVRPYVETGCIVEPVHTRREGLAWDDVLDRLGSRQVTNLLVEGGGRVLGTLFDRRLVDEVHVYVAPLLIGVRGVSLAPARTAASPGPPAARAPGARPSLRLPETTRPRRVGNCWLFEARLRG